MTIQSRAKKILNLEQYAQVNKPERIASTNGRIRCKKDRQYILRMLIKAPLGEWCVPPELNWCIDLIRAAEDNQCKMGIMQPYCYITIRHGIVETKTDDVWHVDGFSMRITHIPEQNYIWSNKYGTEYLEQAWNIPKDFHPIKHNIHTSIFQKQVEIDKKRIMHPGVLYCFDPYVVHRRPIMSWGQMRTLVRISFTPIPIMDDNNTQNPLLPVPSYNIEGVKDFRDKLITL